MASAEEVELKAISFHKTGIRYYMILVERVKVNLS